MSNDMKEELPSIAARNRAMENIIRAMDERNGFLLVGHRSPDEDCIASMVALGLLLTKLNKTVYVALCQRPQEQFNYLLTICRYNAIKVIDDCQSLPREISTIAILDTPKPSMVESRDLLLPYFENPKVLKLEIDHHLEADSQYNGDQGYRLVTAASATCELVGRLAFKIAMKEGLLARYQVQDLFSRNLVLAILTGIIGDSKMGRYLKSRREARFYALFSTMFELMLQQKTVAGSGNYASMEQVFDAVTTLSLEEEACYRYLLDRRIESGRLLYVILNQEESQALYKSYGRDTVSTVSNAVADRLAEDSGYLGVVAYPDDASISDLFQFKVRRSQGFKALDLRDLLKTLAIADGGGHPGAVGFRFHMQGLADAQAHAQELVAAMGEILSKQ